MDIGTVTDFSNDVNTIYSIWDRRNFSQVQKCYTLFQNRLYKPDCNYYFFFEAVPIWILDFIKELNTFFTNIEYQVLDNKYGILRYRDMWGDKIKNIYFNNLETLYNDVKICCPLFTIKLNDGYSPIAKKFIYYVLHHIVRMFSLSEGYLPDSKIKEKPENILDYMILLNNNLSNKYRTVSEIPIDRDYLKLLDNIELVNSTFSVDRFLTQTEILKNLRRSYYTDIDKDEDIFIPVKGYRYYEYGKILYYDVRKIGYLSVKGIYYKSMNGYDNKDTWLQTYVDYSKIIKATTVDKIGNFKIGDLVISRTCYGGNIVNIPEYARITKIFNNAPDKIQHTVLVLERIRPHILFTETKSELYCYLGNIKRLPKTLYERYGIE